VIVNSLGEDLGNRKTCYWNIIEKGKITPKRARLVGMIINYSRPTLYDDSTKEHPRGRTALSLSRVGSAILIEELKELITSTYGKGSKE